MKSSAVKCISACWGYKIRLKPFLSAQKQLPDKTSDASQDVRRIKRELRKGDVDRVEVTCPAHPSWNDRIQIGIKESPRAHEASGSLHYRGVGVQVMKNATKGDHVVSLVGLGEKPLNWCGDQFWRKSPSERLCFQ